MDGQTVKTQILVAFEYAHYRDDWVNPLPDALQGVTVRQALWKPGPDSKGIWDIVLHMAVWTENILARLQSGEPVRPEEGAWPLLPAVPDEPAWEAARQRLSHALDALHTRLDSSPPEALLEGPYGLADLLCRFVHNGYHLGQVTKLRECMPAHLAPED